MRKSLLVLALAIIGFSSEAQQIIAQWNFNSALPPDNNLLTGSTNPSMGAGKTYLIGGVRASNINPFNEGSDNDYFSTSKDNTAWNLTGYPAQNTGSKTAGILFSCNSTGYQNIIFKYDEKRSSSSCNTTIVQYNPDTLVTTGWVDFQTCKIIDTLLINNWITRIIDLSSITAVNDKPRLGIRIVAAFDPVFNTTYIPSDNRVLYEPSGGTIRYDMISITAAPLISCNTPLTQASSPDIIASTNNSINFSFLRGSGDSVIIVCRESYAVNNFPQTGVTYNANANYGFGEEIGLGNYAVYKSNTAYKNTVNITGLTAGKQYYFFIFEFSNGHCYKLQPLYFHATAGGTLLKPGDMMLIGFDTNIPGSTRGNDKHYVTSFVDLKPGTQFCLSSSRYEAGAPANEQTNRWYNSGDNIYKDMDVLEFMWTGTSTISAGSIIAFQNKFNSEGIFDSVTVNGVYQPLFTSDLKKGGFNVATATKKGEQLFITQGSYYAMGEKYIDRYNLFFGRVLFGMSLYTDWVPLSASPGIASSGIAYRSSRLPADIECIHITNLSDTVGAAYFAGATTGTKRFLKTGLGSSTNWKWKVGDSTLNITQQFVSPYSANIGKPFTISASSNVDGFWTGDNNSNWFDCKNWDGLYIPDDKNDVIINSGAPNYPVLDKTAPCKSININPSATINIIEAGYLEIGK